MKARLGKVTAEPGAIYLHVQFPDDDAEIGFAIRERAHALKFLVALVGATEEAWPGSADATIEEVTG